MSQCNRVSDPPDPAFERPVLSILMQLLVNTQERLLAEVARDLRIPDHPENDVPAQALVVPDQLLEPAWDSCEDTLDQLPIPTHAHLPIQDKDTAPADSVAEPAATGPRQPVSE